MSGCTFLRGNFQFFEHFDAFPYEGRRHGEVVTDEVGGTSVYETLSTSSVASGDRFPS